MSTVVEFDFVDARSGKITYSPPSSYVAAPTWAYCQTGQDTTSGDNWRTFFSFNTASLPDSALVSKVEFLIRLAKTQMVGTPAAYRLCFSIGTFIGSALDGTAAEFDAGTFLVQLNSKPADNTWLDLATGGSNPGPYVNLTGDTDLKVWDNSSVGDDPGWSTDLNQSKSKCKLRVTYTIPSGTATGRGTTTAAATVTTAGRSTATGRGTAQATGSVRSAGAAVATGRGTAQAAAVVAAVAVISATGRGEARLLAIVEAVGSVVATGRGAAELSPTTIAVGLGDATGCGTAVVVAFVEVAGSAAATGCGTVSCDAWVQERTASAVATGRGFAQCLLTEIHFDPLARHFGTRTVRAASAGVRSVPRAHAAMRTCPASDERLCGARRLN